MAIKAGYNSGTITAELYNAPDDNYVSDGSRTLIVGVDFAAEVVDEDGSQRFSMWLPPSQAADLAHRLLDLARQAGV